LEEEWQAEKQTAEVVVVVVRAVAKQTMIHRHVAEALPSPSLATLYRFCFLLCRRDLSFATKAPDAPNNLNNTPTTEDSLGLQTERQRRERERKQRARTRKRKTLSLVAKSILAGNGFGYSVPSRSSANQLYVPELDRIVLKDKASFRQFANISSVRKTAITTRILQLVHQLCTKQIHVTKRDLFYTDVKLFQEQGQSDTILDDVSCMLGCTRSSLNVVASEKGVVVGRLIFIEDGDRIDCTKMGVGGKAMPPNIDKVQGMESDALFILLVEKDAAFMRLAEAAYNSVV
jgi:meiotic recombination protein SPO11